MEMTLRELASHAVEIAEETGAMIRQARAPKIYQKPGDANFVTSTDLAAQEKILAALGALLPGAHFFAEEQEQNVLMPGDNWIVDPIDGTSNYMRDFHHSSVSIALVRDGQSVLGVVHNPYLGETFTGIRGEGAWCNGTSIQVSGDTLEQGLVLFGTAPYYREEADATFATAERLFRHCLDVRRLGSAALDLCYVAAGRCVAFYERKLSPWDFAAGAVILREAGGVVATLDGGELDFGKASGVLAANPVAYEAVRALL